MSSDAAVLDFAADDAVSLRRRLILVEAAHEDQRLRLRSSLAFVLLVALVVVIGGSFVWLAAALGMNLGAFVRVGMPIAVGVVLAAGITIAIAVALQIRDAERARLDNRRLAQLQARIASRSIDA